jgi:hypothetical protein
MNEKHCAKFAWCFFHAPNKKTAVVAKNATAAFLIKERKDPYEYQLETEADFPEVLGSNRGLCDPYATGIWCC